MSTRLVTAVAGGNDDSTASGSSTLKRTTSECGVGRKPLPWIGSRELPVTTPMDGSSRRMRSDMSYVEISDRHHHPSVLEGLPATLLINILDATSAATAKSNVRAQSDQLFNLQVQGDKYARLLMAQKHRLRQLDAHWKKGVSEVVARMQCARMADEQRELVKLENRLSSCRTRESKMFAINADLRQRVDELRVSRVLSQTIFEKNQKKLREIQKQMQ
ncbi:hypothetical protein FI667_g2076, partial [Globisporangium splendens]